MMLTILGIDSLGWVMCLAPQTQLFEDIACRKYYSLANRVHVLDAGGKGLCKIPEVQDTVAQLFGWQAFFDGLPGLLLAMPYGVMADKRGRQPVTFLSKLGMLLAMSWILIVCESKGSQLRSLVLMLQRTIINLRIIFVRDRLV